MSRKVASRPDVSTRTGKTPRKVGRFRATLPFRKMLDKEIVKQQVSERLLEARANLDLSQEIAARTVDVSYRTYQRWEERDTAPGPRNRRKIRDKLGVDLADLFPENRHNGAAVDLLRDLNARLERIEAKLDS